MYVVQFLSYTCATEHVLMCLPFWREGVGVGHQSHGGPISTIVRAARALT